MSGGHFNYVQFTINEVADDVDDIINDNNNEDTDEYGDVIGRGYSEPTIEKFKEAAYTLRKAAAMLQRVDWLLSGDDGEGCFHKRWEESVDNGPSLS